VTCIKKGDMQLPAEVIHFLNTPYKETKAGVRPISLVIDETTQAAGLIPFTPLLCVSSQ